MAEKHERSGGAAEGSFQFKPLGTWPTINLVVIEEEDFAHPGSSLTGGSSKESGEESSKAAGAAPKPKYLLRIHTEIEIDQPTYNTLRTDLGNGNNPTGRQNAYKKIENHPQLQRGSATARAMVAAAFDVVKQ